jgi:hypothetical protein
MHAKPRDIPLSLGMRAKTPLHLSPRLIGSEGTKLETKDVSGRKAFDKAL